MAWAAPGRESPRVAPSFRGDAKRRTRNLRVFDAPRNDEASAHCANPPYAWQARDGPPDVANGSRGTVRRCPHFLRFALKADIHRKKSACLKCATNGSGL